MDNIVVVGSINEDFSMLVDVFPKSGETMIAKEAYINNGGKGANQAVAASRLGANVTLIGAIGNDTRGYKMRDSFQKENIHIGGIVTKKTETGFAMITVDQKGNNKIIVNPGANLELTPGDIDRHVSWISKADYCLMQFEIPMRVVEYVIDICNRYNTKVILNPAPFNQEFDKDYLSKIYLYIPNEHEFSASLNLSQNPEKWTKSTLEKKLLEFVKIFKTNIIVTLGEKGSVLCTKDKTIEYVDAVKVKAIDTTGAGDTYIGGLASQLSQGKSLVESMEFSSKASAIAVSKIGAQESIPSLNEVDQY